VNGGQRRKITGFSMASEKQCAARSDRFIEG
jgi:hypothetical protein